MNTKSQLINELADATAGDVIYVNDSAQISLTGEWDITIPTGVTLASGRGKNGSLGARLYTQSQERRFLFQVGGPGVRITGLRIQGPTTVIDGPDCGETDAGGISVSTGTVSQWNLKVDNNELWAWPAAAVSTSKVTGTHVHHNHIHHNRRQERTSGCRAYGLGYGFVTNLGHALIEANLFDHNRHDIASTGRPGSSYEARFNLSVQGLIGHSFDMHGCPDRPTDVACIAHPNTAGTRIDIHHNMFIGNNAYGVNPLPAWFVSFSGTSYWTFRAFSSYAPRDLAFGDFDNDGSQDAFRTSGGAWHVSSSVREKWQEWNTSDYVVSELGFGDFDGNGSTDVFRSSGGKWYVSWGGQTQWQDINRSSYGISGLRFADLNGDGRADFFRTTGSNWYVSWGGRSSWQRVNKSSVTVDRLLFCDFNAHGADDVFFANGSEWRVSWSGASQWQKINTSSLTSIALADVNGDRKCDVLSQRSV